jgi:hypothetical protein
MQGLIGDTVLGFDHVQVLVRGMHQVAKADGLHPVELALLREFYEGCRAQVNGLSAFEDIIATDIELQALPEQLPSFELKDTFIKSCVFLAYADGHYSSEERSAVKGFADALGLSASELSSIEAQVGDTLIQKVARIENVGALQEVAKELRQG